MVKYLLIELEALYYNSLARQKKEQNMRAVRGPGITFKVNRPKA
jgi:hypothetical protein